MRLASFIPINSWMTGIANSEGWDGSSSLRGGAIGKNKPDDFLVVRNRKKDDDDGEGDDGQNFWRQNNNNNTATSSWMPSASILLSWKGWMFLTAVLYIMNQKHVFPRPVTGLLSRIFFWPTLPITAGIRIGKWITPIDETVVMGGAPFLFAGIPQRLHDEYGVRGVVNMCDEYAGPVETYEELGMEQIRLKTVDHYIPSLEDLKSAVSFIDRYKSRGEKVYVHCRAGHGRSGATVFAWLLSQNPKVDRRDLNRRLCQLRNVRKNLWKQPTIREFHDWILSKQPPNESR